MSTALGSATKAQTCFCSLRRLAPLLPAVTCSSKKSYRSSSRAETKVTSHNGIFFFKPRLRKSTTWPIYLIYLAMVLREAPGWCDEVRALGPALERMGSPLCRRLATLEPADAVARFTLNVLTFRVYSSCVYAFWALFCLKTRCPLSLAFLFHVKGTEEFSSA